MFAPLAAAVALAFHPFAAPDFVRYHTHLWDAFRISRMDGLHVAVDGRAVVSPLCVTAVDDQTPTPGTLVERASTLRLQVTASCSSPQRPGVGPPPAVVGVDLQSAVRRLRAWGDNWMIGLPPLPSTRAADLYASFRVVAERSAAGLVQLDAQVAPQTC